MFIFGDGYKFNAIGSCDNCGSPQRLDNVVGIYRGEYPTGHLFEIVSVFSCPGCHVLVDRYNIRADINVTKEYENIKAP